MGVHGVSFGSLLREGTLYIVYSREIAEIVEEAEKVELAMSVRSLDIQLLYRVDLAS
jgi:hypothetical protein